MISVLRGRRIMEGSLWAGWRPAPEYPPGTSGSSQKDDWEIDLTPKLCFFVLPSREVLHLFWYPLGPPENKPIVLIPGKFFSILITLISVQTSPSRYLALEMWSLLNIVWGQLGHFHFKSFLHQPLLLEPAWASSSMKHLLSLGS